MGRQSRETSVILTIQTSGKNRRKFHVHGTVSTKIPGQECAWYITLTAKKTARSGLNERKLGGDEIIENSRRQII